MSDYFFDIETTGLNPYEDKILTIQFKQGEVITIWKIWESDEFTLLSNFVEYLRSVSGNDTVYGYNCLKFDIPFIVARMNYHDIISSETYRIIHDKKWFDLYQYQGDNYISMNRWAKSYGIERACPFNGRDMPLFYQFGKYKEIEAHAIDDLLLCEKLVQNIFNNKI
jgi:uncharacterized protein YprB with RNaseH-like and TPR domain